MLLNEVKIEDLINKVREIALAHPTFVYPASVNGCSYTSSKDGCSTCPCIFGQAFMDLGVSEEQLQGYTDGITKSIIAILRYEDIKRTRQQEYWCSAVQTDQDAGKMWGRAVEAADELYKV